MQKHIQHNKDERTQFFRKIYLSLYSKGLRKGYCVRGKLETEQRLQHIDPHSSGYSSISFSFSWAAQPGAWRPSFCWELVLTPRTGPTDFKLWSPTHLLPVASRLYNCLTSTCFLWHHNSHSIQPVDSQGYLLISSTGCTCYLYRCISHLTARPGWRSICYIASLFFSLKVWGTETLNLLIFSIFSSGTRL